MSHPLRRFARSVQDELGLNPETTRSYDWCLARVSEHVDAARISVDQRLAARVYRETIVVALIDLIKPLALAEVAGGVVDPGDGDRHQERRRDRRTVVPEVSYTRNHRAPARVTTEGK